MKHLLGATFLHRQVQKHFLREAACTEYFFLTLFPFWNDTFSPVLVSYQREDEHLQTFAIRTSTAVHWNREIIRTTPSCAPCCTGINLHSPAARTGEFMKLSQQNNLSSSLSDCKEKKTCFCRAQGAWRCQQGAGISGIAISWQKWAHKGCPWCSGRCPLQREPLSARRHPAEKGTVTNLEFHLKKVRNFTENVNFINCKISASWGKSPEEVKLQIET